MRRSLKIISALAASAMIIGAFTGCGGEKSSEISRIQHGAADCLAG